ncbi:MAG: bifunctional 5,10-methylenetetrahydrofolate dehydrogenase/5,10-methenyltetrahydrofolate cyclohydrolase [Actinomycetota bacterium]
MAARILDGKAIAEGVREEIAREVAELKKVEVVPGLAAVLVGEDPASRIYVAAKRRAAEAVGIASFVHDLPASAGREEVLRLIRALNASPQVHGIIVQLPLPSGLEPVEVQEAVDPAKDVDGLHPVNAGLLALGRPRFVPCTALGVKVLLERSGIVVEGSSVVVVGRSNLVGRPLSILLSGRRAGANATVTLCHTGTKKLAEHTRRGDVLVVAAGAPRAITGKMIKPGATVIDVGISRLDGKLVGDVDFEDALRVAGAITPVPGGVGPMTVAMLLHNTVRAASAAAGLDGE